MISYINCSAGVKEISDIICTSGNALEIVKQIPPEQEIIFCPDKHLGSWIMEPDGAQNDSVGRLLLGATRNTRQGSSPT